jgi:hypothetical protein
MMPTGYTAGIADGKITTLEQYAMACARAFGALVKMRDDPFDAPIPEEMKVDNYYVTSAKEKNEAYEAFIALDQLGLESLHQKEIADAWEYFNKSKAEKKVQADRYAVMLVLAKNWKPPSDDFRTFKEFMVSQIEQSLHFDIYDSKPPENISFKDWLAAKREKMAYEVSYAFKALEEETGRVNKANKWIRALRESLKP